MRSSKSTPTSKPTARSARRRAREFALQGLYGWLVGQGDAGAVDAHVREQEGFSSCDTKHYQALLHGCIDEASALDDHIAQHVDRKTTALSPVEHAALLIGTYELLHCLEVPYRVAINEAVEMAKRFGGTDGHKYVNGVIDKLAASLRPTETRGVSAQGIDGLPRGTHTTT
jgi:transcription antitermination protein NusB